MQIFMVSSSLVSRCVCVLVTLSLASCLIGCDSTRSIINRDNTLTIPLDEFNDVIKHWRDQHPDAEELLLDENDVQGIANNILLYQRSNGGWPTNINPLVKLSAAKSVEVLADKSKLDSSLDNRNTYPQIRYLSFAYQKTNDLAYRNAVVKGIFYLLENQYENGGWAHSPPRVDGYYGHITFADEVMPGVLTLLRDVAKQHYPFGFVDKELRQKSKDAWLKGEKLLLDLQVTIDGELTIWAGQYDKESLLPVDARTYELAGLQTWESVAVVKYLMMEEQPDNRITRAIKSAVSWFEKNKISNLRIETVITEPLRFEYYTSTYDLFEVYAESAPPIWARFYDLKTRQPFMANRDGGKVYKLADIKRERRAGYTWYGYWPQTLLDIDYPQWQREHSVN